jgi:hypothetical protein
MSYPGSGVPILLGELTRVFAKDVYVLIEEET